MRRTRLLDAQGDLVGDADAVAFQGDDFFRVIGENADVFEAEIDEDLRPDAAFVLHHALASGLAIQLAAGMKVNLRQRARLGGRLNPEATAGMVEI